MRHYLIVWVWTGRETNYQGFHIVERVVLIDDSEAVTYCELKHENSPLSFVEMYETTDSKPRLIQLRRKYADKDQVGKYWRASNLALQLQSQISG